MQRTYSPEALARREARKAETAARNAAKQAAAKAAKQAEWEERNRQYAAAQQQKRDTFLTSMTEQDRSYFEEALKIKTFEPNDAYPNGMKVTDEFMKSLHDQFHGRGFLSDKQRDIMIAKGKKIQELREASAKWPEIKEGDKVEVLCTALGVEQTRTSFGITTKIRLRSHYGRIFTIKTGREDWIALARSSVENKTKIVVEAKVTWIAPQQGGTVVLTSRGAYFGRL